MEERTSVKPRSALLIVDVQNDFCTGGALAVPGSERVVNAINRYLAVAAAGRTPVYASRDWHPPVTAHFAAYGGTWPVHCVRDTKGAAFHPDLALPPDATVVTKGETPGGAGYSAFEGTSPDGQPLEAHLRARGIAHLDVVGLATDYCVKHTVLDALAAGFSVDVLDDGIAGVNLQPDDSARALADMRSRGAHVIQARPAPAPA